MYRLQTVIGDSHMPETLETSSLPSTHGHLKAGKIDEKLCVHTCNIQSKI